MNKLLDVYMKISRQQPEMLQYAMQLYTSMPSAKSLIQDDEYIEVKGLGLIQITYDDFIKAKVESLEYMIQAESRRRAEKQIRGE